MASDDEIERLSNDLQSDEGITRAYAAEVLGSIGDPKAVEPLIERLEDSDSNVRYRAAEALGKIGDVRAVGPLIERVEDDNSTVVSCATEALVKIGEKIGFEKIIELMKQYDSSKLKDKKKFAGVYGELITRCKEKQRIKGKLSDGILKHQKGGLGRSE